MCSEGSRKASGGRLRELAALGGSGGSGYADSGRGAGLKGMLGRLRGVPRSVLDRCLTASDMAEEAGGMLASWCSGFELERESTTGEAGMDRDDCAAESSARQGGARLSLDGRLRASLGCGGSGSVLGPARLEARCRVMGGGAVGEG